MAALKGSKTEQCLKDAFAGESQANRRYLYFANKADVEGQNDVAALFRSTAEGETGHAHGHLEFLEEGLVDVDDDGGCGAISLRTVRSKSCSVSAHGAGRSPSSSSSGSKT